MTGVCIYTGCVEDCAGKTLLWVAAATAQIPFLVYPFDPLLNLAAAVALQRVFAFRCPPPASSPPPPLPRPPLPPVAVVMVVVVVVVVVVVAVVVVVVAAAAGKGFRALQCAHPLRQRSFTYPLLISSPPVLP